MKIFISLLESRKERYKSHGVWNEQNILAVFQMANLFSTKKYLNIIELPLYSNKLSLIWNTFLYEIYLYSYILQVQHNGMVRTTTSYRFRKVRV